MTDQPQRGFDRSVFCRYPKSTQRITTKQWRNILLAGEDTIVTKGLVRKMGAKNLGAGVIEVYLLPVEETP